MTKNAPSVVSNVASLADLRRHASALETAWHDSVAHRTWDFTHWDWLAAVDAYALSPATCTPAIISLATDPIILAAHDAYLSALHAYYLARDGDASDPSDPF